MGKQLAIARLLSSLPLFQQLRENEILSLAAGTRKVQLYKGRILFQKGDLLEGFYVVV